MEKINNGLRELLIPFLTSWPQEDKLDQRDYEINRYISQLDAVAIGYEAKWGVGVLEGCADPSDGIGAKWQRQLDKLLEALQQKDVVAVRTLVDGFIRGWPKLEENAVSLGHAPRVPEFWEYRQGSTIYRVVKNTIDAKALNRGREANEGQQVEIVCMEEMIRLYDAERRSIFDGAKKRHQGERDAAKPIDWKEGDPLPF